MKVIKIVVKIILLLAPVAAFCQEGSGQVEMADVLRRDGKIYTVVFGLLIILTAMIVLLIRVDRKIFNLEKRSDDDR